MLAWAPQHLRAQGLYQVPWEQVEGSLKKVIFPALSSASSDSRLHQGLQGGWEREGETPAHNEAQTIWPDGWWAPSRCSVNASTCHCYCHHSMGRWSAQCIMTAPLLLEPLFPYLQTGDDENPNLPGPWEG